VTTKTRLRLTFFRDQKNVPVSEDSWYLAYGANYAYSVRYDIQLDTFRFGVWTRCNVQPYRNLLVECKACCDCENRAHGMRIADAFEAITDVSDLYKRLAIARAQVAAQAS
jgi:hypothetical protein